MNDNRHFPTDVDMTKFENMITQFTLWSTTIGFPEATKMSSLIKCREEVHEISWAFNKPKNELTEEYVDALMCLFDSSARAGISTKEIVDSFLTKLKINITRVWKKNADNTYSHV